MGVVRKVLCRILSMAQMPANKGMTISFQHVPSEEDVTFKAFITTFNETYNCDWQSETVFGRSDPIHMFKNTAREITLAFNVPAATEGESFENMARVQRLITFLYPSYDGQAHVGDKANQADVTNSLTIANSPLIRLRIMNILAARPQIGDAKGSTVHKKRKHISPWELLRDMFLMEAHLLGRQLQLVVMCYHKTTMVDC